MKILTLPFEFIKQAFEKIQNFIQGTEVLFHFLFQQDNKYRPSRMYRLLFSKTIVTKKIVQEQYVVEEPEYYGNYE
jgi:hypothetical protein